MIMSKRSFAVFFGCSPFKSAPVMPVMTFAFLLAPVVLVLLLAMTAHPEGAILAMAAPVANFEELAKEWEAFQVSNDKRLAELKKGIDDPLLKDQVDEHSAALGEMTAAVEAQQKAFKEEQKRNDELEKKVNRGDLGGAGIQAKEMAEARQFFALVQNISPENVEVDIEAYREYSSAFAQYLRRGDKGLGIKQALEVGSDPGGGYWVVPDKGGRIVELIFESSPIRQIASVTQIGTDALEGIYDLDEADSGWVGEKASRSDTDEPDVGEYRIPVHEQYAQPSATQKVLDDSIVDVEGWLMRKAADKLARRENTAFVNGTGVLQPRGFLTYSHGTPSATTFDVIERIPTGTSGGFGSPNPGDELIDVVYTLKSFYRANARWVMARATVGEVRKLKDGDNNYLWQPNFTDLSQTTLLGFPITEAEDMPVIASNSLSMGFGDWRAAYQIVDRIGIRVLRDPFTNKPYVRFYTTKRVGGDVINFEAIKLVRFAAAAG